MAYDLRVERLSDDERKALRSFAAGDVGALAPALRLRFEMLGLVRELASGVVITGAGQACANRAPVARKPAPPPVVKTGRRKNPYPF